MSTLKENITQIQAITYDACQASGQVAALLDAPDSRPEAVADALEQTAARLERGTVELRALCESCLPPAPIPMAGQRPVPPPLDAAGRIEANEFGWLHIQLNTLLPHCRFAPPLWLTDTISRLLDQHEQRHGKLPMMECALLAIDEYCDVDSRQVYDADNKGWKAVSNAIKGRLIADDDQFSLSLCLLSQRSPEKVCHIYVLPMMDAGDFFFMRSEQYPFFR
ncbi:MAG: hypothetical protein NC489_23580 [Ruminococcus flavefaciens]|nr:hypothetical protein [Ruminococcus flavefaciens]